MRGLSRFAIAEGRFVARGAMAPGKKDIFASDDEADEAGFDISSKYARDYDQRKNAEALQRGSTRQMRACDA